MRRGAVYHTAEHTDGRRLPDVAADTSPTQGEEAVTEPDSVDPDAEAVPETDVVVPLLPRGVPLFESIASPAIVIEALGPVVGDGLVVVRSPEGIRGPPGEGRGALREARLLVRRAT